MNQLRPLNPFNNVVASGIANCDLNPLLGTTLECINLSLAGTAFTKSMITSIQLKANGKVIWESDGSKADASECFKTNIYDATKLSINFMEPNAKTVNAFQAGSIDLSPESGITNLRLEVTISGATAPALSGIAEVSPALDIATERAIRFLIGRRHRATQTIGASGVPISLQVPHLDPSGGGSVYKRILIYSANCTAIKAMREGITEFDVTRAEMEWIQKKANRAPVANLFVFDPILDGIQAGRLWDTRPSSGVKSAQLYGTFSAGETITIETEELLPLNMY